jgi:GT2 family glycosyltransferase
MDLSIIILNYNTFDLTCNCIKSIKEKTSGITYEIVLVDNASVECNPDNFLRLFPNIVLIKNNKNSGFAAGNNLGIASASGEYILLLNSDTLFRNNAAALALYALKKHKEAAVISGALFYPDGSVQHNAQRFPSITHKLFEFFRLQKIVPSRWSGKILLGAFFKHDVFVYPDWVWGTFFMFRKNILQQLPGGKLADDFFMYVEDMQWCKEFHSLGYRIAFDPAPRITHIMASSGGPKLNVINANAKIFLDRYYSGWQRYVLGVLDRLLKR